MISTAICACAKMENDYIVEWTEYHLGIGFDCIIICDNNAISDDSLATILAPYVKSGKVVIMDYRGMRGFQMRAYNDCYRRFGNDYDWMAFIDIDEFITFGPDSETDNINRFLEKVPEADCLILNWEMYGDCGQIRKKSGPVTERFPYALPADCPDNKNIKSIVRTKLDVEFKHNPHAISGKGDKRIIKVDDMMNEVEFSPLYPFHYPGSYKKLYIRHYATKSIEEFIKGKMARGAADRNKKYDIYNLKQFYLYNGRNKEKRNVERELCPHSKVIEMDITYILNKIKNWL